MMVVVSYLVFGEECVSWPWLRRLGISLHDCCTDYQDDFSRENRGLCTFVDAIVARLSFHEPDF